MRSIEQRLGKAAESVEFSKLNLEFADLMARLSQSESPILRDTAALVSHSTESGNVCLSLGHLGFSEAEYRSVVDEIVKFPVAGRPGGQTPLIVDQSGRIYLYRYWDYEQRLYKTLLKQLGKPVEGVDLHTLKRGIDRLFPNSGVEVDWQCVAAALSVLHQLVIISGGPGTGKTTTVVRILALLLEQHPDRELRVALGAPTGKAATRLQESVQHAKAQMKLPAALLDKIPTKAQTIHRLLGARPGTTSLKYHRHNPMPLDILIVDEVSMIDTALMVKLLEALQPTTRVVLLGDKDQLASVEAGAVLADICTAYRGYDRVVAEQLESITGHNISEIQSTPGTVSNGLAFLRDSYRFSAEAPIGRLATSINAGQVEEVWDLLSEPSYTDLVLFATPQEAVRKAVAHYADCIEAVLSEQPIAKVFELFNQFRLLAALREGVTGVSGLNREVEMGLVRQGLVDPRIEWYPGRPVILQRNDPKNHLYNGDVGITTVDPERGAGVIFPAESGYRFISPGRLPRHETAFALTVHKSQGSEFDHVCIVLPENGELPVLSRELLYTAVTRARKSVSIVGTEAVIKQTVARVTKRSSGLPDLLNLPVDA